MFSFVLVFYFSLSFGGNGEKKGKPHYGGTVARGPLRVTPDGDRTLKKCKIIAVLGQQLCYLHGPPGRM